MKFTDPEDVKRFVAMEAGGKDADVIAVSYDRLLMCMETPEANEARKSWPKHLSELGIDGTKAGKAKLLRKLTELRVNFFSRWGDRPLIKAHQLGNLSADAGLFLAPEEEIFKSEWFTLLEAAHALGLVNDQFRRFTVLNGTVSLVPHEDFSHLKLEKKQREVIQAPKTEPCHACPERAPEDNMCACGKFACSKHSSTQKSKFVCADCAHCVFDKKALPNNNELFCEQCEKAVCPNHSTALGAGSQFCFKCRPDLKPKQVVSSPPPYAQTLTNAKRGRDAQRNKELKDEQNSEKKRKVAAEIADAKEKAKQKEEREAAQEKAKKAKEEERKKKK